MKFGQNEEKKPGEEQRKQQREKQKEDGKPMIKAIKQFLWDNRLFLSAVVILLFLNFRFDFYYIKTGSMQPSLPVGTVVVVDISEDTIIHAQAGEIFAYQSGKNVVVHRIVSVDEGGYTFKGDANPSADAVKITRNQLVGKVVAKIKILLPVTKLFEYW